jgi:hypothetical protein
VLVGLEGELALSETKGVQPGESATGGVMQEFLSNIDTNLIGSSFLVLFGLFFLGIAKKASLLNSRFYYKIFKLRVNVIFFLVFNTIVPCIFIAIGIYRLFHQEFYFSIQTFILILLMLVLLIILFVLFSIAKLPKDLKNSSKS